MKETVLHIAEKSEGGGSESVFRDTVNSLRIHDFKRKHLIACIPGANNDVSVDYTFKPPPSNNLLKLLASIFSFSNYMRLRHILNDCKPSIIHIQNYANLSPSVLWAIYHYKKQGYLKKVINTVHTFEYVCSNHAAYDYKQGKVCTDCKKNTYKFKIFYRGCSRAGFFHSIGKGVTSLIAAYIKKKEIIDFWVTPSEFLKTQMLYADFFKDKQNSIFVVRNPLSWSFEQPLNISMATKQNSIIYFGRLSEEKNIELLIEGFSIYKKQKKTDVKLFIAGEGIMYAKLKKITDDLKLSSDVIFTGFLKPAELKMQLLNCKVSVLPSKCFETASMLVVESLFASCLPLVANQGGMQEMVNWTNFGKTFEANDAQDLAIKLSYLLENYEDEIMESDKIKNKILPQLSSLNYANQLIKLYE